MSSLAIFTADSVSSTTVNVGILHESGIVVYKTNVDNIDHNTQEKYGLAGERRYIQSITDVVLKKGLKYYIQYTNENNTFKPAYFSDINGNYVNWHHGTLQSKSVANLNSVTKYLGDVSDAAVWLAANENELMICANNLDSLNNTDAYIRNNLCNAASIIGQNGQTLPAVEKDKILQLDTGEGFMYIGNNYTESSGGSNVTVLENQHIYTKTSQLDNTKYKGIKTTAKGILDDLDQYDYCIYNGTSVSQVVTQNHIYQKIEDLDIGSDIDLDDYSGNALKLMHVIKQSAATATYSNVAIKNGYMYYADRTGYVYKLKSNYTVDLGPNDAGYSGSSAPHVTNCIYYLNDATATWQAGMWMWNGSTWELVGVNDSSGQLDNFFDITTFASVIQEIMLNGSVAQLGTTGRLIELVKTHYDGAYISNTIKQQTVETDKKFYLEINGREV